MKKVAVIAIISLLLSACTSMSKKVHENVHEGDSAETVTQLLGKPDVFMPSTNIPGADAWIYYDKHDLCGFTIKENQIKRIACMTHNKTSDAVTFIDSLLKGVGQGLGNASERQYPQPNPTVKMAPTNCVSSVSGNQVFTNCY